MCGRYALYDTEELGRRFNLTSQPEPLTDDNYNAAPRQWLPAIVQSPAEQRVAGPMQWGSMPPWARDPLRGLRPINTNGETAFASRMWKDPIARHRCLVPSRGFYEWQRADNRKVPYFIHPKDQDLFAFAGLFSLWHDDADRLLYSFSIMTTAPNRHMEPVHNRMPVTLDPLPNTPHAI